jgi:hypothetical protein
MIANIAFDFLHRYAPSAAAKTLYWRNDIMDAPRGGDVAQPIFCQKRRQATCLPADCRGL